MFETVKPPRAGEIITAEFLEQLADAANRSSDGGLSSGQIGFSSSEFSRSMPANKPELMYVVMIRDAFLAIDPDISVTADNPDGEENAEELEFDTGAGDWISLGGRKVMVYADQNVVPLKGDRVHVRYNAAFGGYVAVAVNPIADQEYILIRNISTADIAKYGIVALGSIVSSPAFAGTWVFDSSAPSASTPFAIVQQALAGVTPEQDIGVALFHGVSRCKVFLTSNAHTQAAPASNNYVRLVSQSAAGPAEILYKNAPAAWSGATTYAAGDVVTVAAVPYTCILTNTNQTPPNGTYWTVGTEVVALVRFGFNSLGSSGSGITTINDQAGPAITLESTDGTVVIDNPSANVLNLHACPLKNSIGGSYVVFGTQTGYTGTFTVPSCVTTIEAEVFACGGHNDASGTFAGGGGGGAYASKSLTVTPGDTLHLVISRNTGGFSRIQDNSLAVVVSAENGDDNSASNSGAHGGRAANCVGTVKYSGGNGGLGSLLSKGGGGGGGAGPAGNGSDGEDYTVAHSPAHGGDGYSIGQYGGTSTATAQLSLSYPGSGAGGNGAVDSSGQGYLGGFGAIRLTWGVETSVNGASGAVTLQGTGGIYAAPSLDGAGVQIGIPNPIIPAKGGTGIDASTAPAGQTFETTATGTFAAEPRKAPLVGIGPPDVSLGYAGDVYIDTSTGDFYYAT